MARLPRTLQKSTEGTPSTGAPLPGTDIRLVRLALHRRAPENLRRQFTRAALRVASLVVADLLVLVALRELHRLIGDVGWLLPRGYLSVWQDASALVLGLAVTGNYGPGDDHRDPARLFGGCALATALLLWSAPWSRSLVPVLLQCVPTVVVVWAAVVAERAVVDLLVQRFAPSPSIMVPTLAVGSLDGFKDLVAGRGLWWMQDCRSVGFVDVATPPSAASLGGLADLPHLLDELKVERVVMCGYIPDDEFARVLDAAVVAGCELLAIPPWSLHAGTHPRLVRRRGQVLFELSPLSTLPLPHTLAYAPQRLYARYGKRALDIVGASVGILLGAVPVIIAAAAMRLDSRGKAFLLQPRVGRGGRVFEMLKLRTMVAGAERDGVARWASAADPRVTQVGRWVRRLRIDELPQLVNVLLGQMSLIGPRPERPELHDQIVQRYPDFVGRLAVKPGITGLAQVLDGYADSLESSERKLALDLGYTANLSLWLDVVILLKTVRVLATGAGSR